MTYVPPFGPSPSRWMIIGEAPGREEGLRRRPFVGKAGLLQQSLLQRNGFLQSSCRLANVYPIYRQGNPDPSPHEIEEYTHSLVDEINTTNPSVIIAVGRFAIRWFLGDSADLEEVHGVPHKTGRSYSFASSRISPDIIIVPVHHPASTFYGEEEEKTRKRRVVDYDYRQAVDVIKRIQKGETVSCPFDHCEGQEDYRDVTGHELSSLLSDPYTGLTPDSILGIDTEETPSIQVSWHDGTGYVLRACQSDFSYGISELQRIIDTYNPEIVTHDADTPSGCLYDIRECRKLGLELRYAKWFNTMYNLYLYRGEPKGLKPAAYRFCGVRLTPYQDMIGEIGRGKQIEYLESVLSHKDNIPIPEKRLIEEGDGTTHFYKPTPIWRSVEKLLDNVYSDKLDKNGNLIDPYEKWYEIGKQKKVGRELRKPVEQILGKMPRATLNDIPLAKATRYAAADADVTRRLSYRCKERNARMGLTRTMTWAMAALPMFEEIQSNGMPAERGKLEDLSSLMSSVMDEKRLSLSVSYFDGLPFNPKSTDQVAVLLEKRGLTPAKRTKTGAPSTAKKSIEHLRHKDPAIGLVFDYREHQHIRDSFCRPLLETFPEGVDRHDVICNLNVAKTETGRPSSEDPNLLNIPVRTEIGRMIRACFTVEPGQLLVAADLSQIELRALAHDSGSPFMIRAFLLGKDIHSETATAVFGVKPPGKNATPEEESKWEFGYRRPAKTTNFGIVYGQQKYGLHDQFRMYGLDNYSMDDTERLRAEVYRVLGIDDYVKRRVSEARRTGTVTDISGMSHYIPNLFAEEDKVRAEAERQVISYHIQSMAQRMIQNSMGDLAPKIWKLQRAGIDVKPRLQVYDELIFTCQEDMAGVVGDMMVDSMENHCGVKLKVPVKAKVHIGTDWSMLK